MDASDIAELKEGQAGLQQQFYGLDKKVDLLDARVDARHEENRSDITELKEDIHGSGHQPGLKADVASIKTDVAIIKENTSQSAERRRFQVGQVLIPILAAALAAVLTAVAEHQFGL